MSQKDNDTNSKKEIPRLNISSELDKQDVELQEQLTQINLTFETKKAQIRLRIFEEELERSKQEWRANLRLRKQFAYVMIILVGMSNLATLILLFLLGFKFRNFHLSDTVVVAVISATVAELASIFLIIIKYLFRVEVLPGDVIDLDES